MYKNAQDAAEHHRRSCSTITVWWGKNERGEPDHYVGVNWLCLTLDVLVFAVGMKLLLWLFQ